MRGPAGIRWLPFRAFQFDEKTVDTLHQPCRTIDPQNLAQYGSEVRLHDPPRDPAIAAYHLDDVLGERRERLAANVGI